jgi:type III restriction enzyme
MEEATYKRLIEKIQEIAKERNENYSELFTQLLIEKCIEADGSVIPENREKLYSICPELREGLNQGKVIERKDKSASTTTIRKKQYEQISKLWELLNQKYIIKYDKFTNQELEYAILEILQEGLESDDEIVTKRNILSLSDDGAKTEELAGLSLATNKKLKYNDFLIKLSENTNIPIINIHNSLVKYSKIKYIDSKFFNETVLTNFIIKIEEWKENELFSRFTYKKTDLPIHPTALTDENGNLRETIGIGNIGTSKLDVKPQERYLYDTVAFDSPIEKDNIFEQISEVTVFGKIPKSSVKIPVANGGTYSPDFMYLVDKKDGSSELNLVIESKDVKMQKSLRGEEIYKIKCAEKLFGELKNSGINVVYKRQLKSNKMATIIRNIVK